MIDTVLLCIAWAVIGYALALIENEWEIAKYERDSRQSPRPKGRGLWRIKPQVWVDQPKP